MIEDPVHTDSSASQLIQIADHVAWSANAALSPIKAHDFAHRWYDTHLSLRDPHRRPQAI
ncbi:DUF3800 domain-containing protein [Arthrobacter sp. UM1]|uniref:DUF3800 domain-containing protein n=1 Tax=Arthrobacter sp. UM1 TaxID=2766776 RepID=UPI001CF62444